MKDSSKIKKAPSTKKTKINSKSKKNQQLKTNLNSVNAYEQNCR